MADPDLSDDDTPEMGETSIVQRIRSAGDPLSSHVRRAAIEKHLDPVDIGTFILQGSTEQKVKLALDVMYRTKSKQHSLWLSRLLANVVGQDSMLYAENLGAVLNLAAELVSLDGRPIGADIWEFSKESQYDAWEKAMKDRIAKVQALPEVFVDDLMVNQAWFQDRVRMALATMNMEALGN